MISKNALTAANQRAAMLLAITPAAIAARYDRRLARIIVDLNNGLSVMFNPHDAQGLEKAMPEQLRNIEIAPSGLGLHFPSLDADLYLPSLLQGFLGSPQGLALQKKKIGYQQPRPRAKTAALRAKGKPGSHPKKLRPAAVA